LPAAPSAKALGYFHSVRFADGEKLLFQQTHNIKTVAQFAVRKLMIYSTQPANLVIRPATVSDAATLARLRYALRSSTGKATEPEVEFITRCAAWMKTHLQEPGAWQCWVAEINQQLTGAIWLQLIGKIPNPQDKAENLAYISNFYVAESARGGGIGSQLLHTAIEWCKTHDVDEIVLWPTDRSRTLYQRYGFAVRDNLMEKILKDDDIQT